MIIKIAEDKQNDCNLVSPLPSLQVNTAHLFWFFKLSDYLFPNYETLIQFHHQNVTMTISNATPYCMHIKNEIWFFIYEHLLFRVILSKKAPKTVRRHTNNNKKSKSNHCVCVLLYTICIDICLHLIPMLWLI